MKQKSRRGLRGKARTKKGHGEVTGDRWNQQRWAVYRKSEVTVEYLGIVPFDVALRR